MNVRSVDFENSSCRKIGTPAQWIGVRAAWQLNSLEPWDQLVSITPKELTTHGLLLGATGSGKTNLLHHLLAQDIERGHSVCLLDMRGDLVSAATEICAGSGVDPKKVLLLDLREKNQPAGFNPMFGSGEPYFRALNVLDVIAKESESWGVQLSETLRNALLLFSETGERLTQLDALFYDPDFRQSVVSKAQSETVVAFWQRFEMIPPERQAGFAMPVLNKVSLLLSTPTLRKILGHPKPVDLGKHLNTPGSITLVSLAVDELHASGRMMGNLFLSAVCREVFARVDIAEKDRNPVRLYVDEFENFSMSDFEAILAEGRRFGLSLVLAHQTLAQLTPRIRSMILNNVGVKFVFRLGREDSAKMSKDLYGNAREYDFCDLPRGYAVFWRRDKGAVEVEVNEPFLRHIGTLSARAQTFHSQLTSQAVAVEASAPNSLTPVVSRSKNNPPPKAKQESLEDWLCD